MISSKSGKLAHRLDRAMMALALDQAADRDQCRTLQPERGSDRGAIVGRTEQVGLDAVAQHRNLFVRRAQFDQDILQGGADGDQRAGVADRALDQPPRNR